MEGFSAVNMVLPSNQTRSRGWLLPAILLPICACLLMCLALVLTARAQTGRWGHPDRVDSLRVLDRRPGSADLPSGFELGLEAATQISRYYGLVETDSLLDRLNAIGYRVALAANQPDVLFTFQILDMDEPNAMALPGGWIFVTRGILDLGLTDAELAHLLGHEISHVTHSHFSRQGRLDGLLSLLQTALLVTVSIAGSSDQGSRTGIVIEDPDSYYSGQTSQSALATGTAIFGSVFHELLLRGYGRRLEMEADDGGRRLASLAGYPREAGEGLLQKLHDRIFEDREFGYWRTHPFFSDRVRVARAVSRGADSGPTEAEIAQYRAHVHQELASAASSFRSGPVSEYLYERALRAGPDSGTSLSVHLDLLLFRRQRLERRPSLERAYGPMIQECDSLLSVAAGTPSEPADALRRIRDLRELLARDRDALLPGYEAAMNARSLSPVVAEAFLRNFPEHDSAGSVRLRLARLYRLSLRNNLAAMQLSALLRSTNAGGSSSRPGEPADTTGAALREDARLELERTIPLLEDPETCELLRTRIDDAKLVAVVEDRLDLIADSVKTLETLGRFVQAYPDSPSIARFRSRLDTLAESEYRKGRLHESLGDQQSALDQYNRVAILAQGTKAASEARRGIARIQSLAEADE